MIRRPRPSTMPASGDGGERLARPALNVRVVTSPPVSSRGAPAGLERPRVQEPDPAVVEADRDQPAVRAELPRWVSGQRVEPAVVRERERTSEPPLPAEVPGDRAPVGARRVERPAVGAEDRLPDGVRVAAQRLAGSQRAGVPDGHRPVAARRHDGLAVRAELQPDRARREGAPRLPRASVRRSISWMPSSRPIAARAAIRAEGERAIALAISSVLVVLRLSRSHQVSSPTSEVVTSERPSGVSAMLGSVHNWESQRPVKPPGSIREPICSSVEASRIVIQLAPSSHRLHDHELRAVVREREAGRRGSSRAAPVPAASACARRSGEGTRRRARRPAHRERLPVRAVGERFRRRTAAARRSARTSACRRRRIPSPRAPTASVFPSGLTAIPRRAPASLRRA